MPFPIILLQRAEPALIMSVQKPDGVNVIFADFEQSDIDADCIIVLGGDGYTGRAARDMASIGIPLIGVNMGTLGLFV